MFCFENKLTDKFIDEFLWQFIPNNFDENKE